jgi:hypothetical protein
MNTLFYFMLALIPAMVISPPWLCGYLALLFLSCSIILGEVYQNSVKTG